MTESTSTKELQRIHILSSLDEQGLRSLALSVRNITYTAGQKIQMHNNLEELVVFVLKGTIRLTNKMIAGREILIHDLREGEYFTTWSDVNETDADVLATCLSDCQLGFAPQAVFQSLLLKHPEMTLQHLQGMTKLLRGLNARMHDVMFLNARLRVQKVLLEFVVPTAQGNLIKDLPTHADLAALADTQREVVSRELSRLVRKKSIVKTKSGYRVPDPRTLGSI